MRIVRFKKSDGAIEFGKLLDDHTIAVIDSPFGDIRETGENIALKGVELLAPVEPLDILAIGLNYRQHAIESNMAFPEAPVLFIKASSSATGPDSEIRLPEIAPNEVDYEAELALVVGKTACNVSEDEALEYLLGCTCANDVSARDCQLRQDVQWARAKSFDTFCPLGPWIETDVDPDNLPIRSRLNGNIMQESNTSDQIFTCRQLISYLSKSITLRPGTVILTGTPEGVGFARPKPVFLKGGDVIQIEIEGIGTLTNHVTA